MSSFDPPMAILAVDVIQQAAIVIIFVICVGLMLVPIAAVAIFVFVELRAYRRDRPRRAQTECSDAGQPVVPRSSVIAPRGEST